MVFKRIEHVGFLTFEGLFASVIEILPQSVALFAVVICEL